MNTRLFAVFVIAACAPAIGGCTNSGTLLNPPGGARASHVVIGDVEQQAVVTFPATATGTVTPTYNLVGASTGLDEPYDIFVDKAQNAVYASNYAGGTGGTITKYALTATGNAAPTTTIGPGGSTTLQGPTGIYVTSSGVIYVADYEASAIDVFAAGASGTTVAPTSRITSTSLSEPESLWLDATGNVWVASDGNGSILEFAPSAGTGATPTTTISGSNTGLVDTTALFIDAHGNIWTANCTAPASVEEFAAGSTGNVSPTKTILGANTNMGCPYGVIVDQGGYVYEADYGTKSVNVFSPSASGNAAPVQSIPANTTTGLGEPSGIGLY